MAGGAEEPVELRAARNEDPFAALGSLGHVGRVAGLFGRVVGAALEGGDDSGRTLPGARESARTLTSGAQYHALIFNQYFQSLDSNLS